MLNAWTSRVREEGICSTHRPSVRGRRAYAQRVDYRPTARGRRAYAQRVDQLCEGGGRMLWSSCTSNGKGATNTPESHLP
eukprot:1186834-Prorocentrum_minimum.AAC.7